MEIDNRKLAMKITSRDNSLLRRARAVRDGKVREAIFIEGLRLCEEALASGLQIESVIYSHQLVRKDRASRLIQRLERATAKSASVSEKLLESISYTSTPQGIVMLAARPDTNQQTFTAKQSRRPLVVILHEINNPVNVGAIIRTAEAAGATGFIATAKTADPFSPKALRGAMGSAFRLAAWSAPRYEEAIAWCKTRKVGTIIADVSGHATYTTIDWAKPAALIVGRESSGLSPDEMAAADEVVRVPMQGATESLNVAVAAGVILFEAARQRAEI